MPSKIEYGDYDIPITNNPTTQKQLICSEVPKGENWYDFYGMVMDAWHKLQNGTCKLVPIVEKPTSIWGGCSPQRLPGGSFYGGKF